MERLNLIYIGVFVAFVVCVISVGMFKSRKEKTSEDYFLAGRGLVWPLIGFSLIAANISTEQFVGMSGNAAFFTIVQSPDEEAIMMWESEKENYIIAVYPDDTSMKAIKIASPFVFPITQADFDKAQVGEHTIFESEDEAWESVNPGLAVEVNAYNTMIKNSAKEAGVLPTAERPIAYKYDTTLTQLLGKVLPQGVGLVGFVLAALLGAVVSSLAAMLNAASTIFSMDLYKRYISPNASQGALVFQGRICVVVFAGVAVFIAPQLGNPKISNSIFTIIQESQGFLSPGILAVFVFGLLVRKAPPIAGVIGLVTNFIAYIKGRKDCWYIHCYSDASALCNIQSALCCKIKGD